MNNQTKKYELHYFYFDYSDMDQTEAQCTLP